MDKYGRALEKESSVNDLKRYYRIDSPEADAIKRGQVEVEGEEQNDEDDDEDEDEDEEEPSSSSAPTTKSFMDLARGEVLLESSDEEEEEVIDDDDDEEGSESDSSSSAAGSVSLGPSSSRRRRRPPSRSPSIDLSETERPVFDDDEDESDEDDDAAEPTRRVAVVNMDWDNLRASDLYRVLASSLSATASTSSVAVAPPPPKASGSSTKFDRDGNEVGPYKPSAKLSIAPGRLLNLRIYPSTFGRERMEREAVEGPPVEVLRTKGADSDEDDEDGGHKLKGKGKEKRRRRAASNDDDEEDEYTAQDLVNDQVHENEEDYDTEALRKYQLERLRYFYAIATFDTATAAKHVVSEINGTEFERTANVFDLQFVPDETSFDDDPVHEEATEASIAAEGNSYQGIDFSTDALRHSRVKLTWDADDPHRKTKLETYLAAALDKSKQKGATKGRPNVADADIAEYLASSSDEDDDDARRADERQEDEQDDFFEAAASDEILTKSKSKKEQKRDKLRSLFGLDDARGEQSWDGGDKSTKGHKAGEMQITFAPALSERSAKQLDLVEGDKPETAIETYRRKEKERKERKKLERRAKLEGKDFDPYEGPFGGDQQGADDVEDKGFDDDFFADDGGKDPFSAYDDGNVSSGDEIGIAAKGKKQQQKKKLSKKDKKAMREQDEERERAEQSELALLVGSDDEDDVLGGDGEGGKHFDMRKILKAEKAKGKKVKAKGKHQRKAVSDGAPVQDEFKLDLADDRFKSLHDDFDFAIDPSNPR